MIFETFASFYWSISYQIFNHPITSISIQLCICIVFLSIYTIIAFHCCSKHHPVTQTPNNPPLASSINANQYNDLSSWANLFISSEKHSAQRVDSTTKCIFQKHFFHHFLSNFWFKLRLIILPSLCFSANIVVTTIIKAEKSQNIRILLSATEIIWFILLSPFLCSDYPTKGTLHAILCISDCAYFQSFGVLCNHDNPRSCAVFVEQYE